MKTMKPQSFGQNWRVSFCTLKSFAPIIAILALAGLPLLSFGAAGTWNGSTSTDWNTAANWTGGVPSGGNATITTTNPRIATITANISATPVDILVGTGAGTIGRVDHIAGNAFTGNGNWMWMGYQGGIATYNLADTTTTGGTFTGYGQGSGNLNVGGASQNGNILLGLDNGTVSTLNINSSGTVAAGYLSIGANGAPTSTLNIDNGTVNISGDAQIGGNMFNQSSGVSTLNMSGGTLTANLIVLSRGNNNASVMQGTANVTGGTLNSKTWFTLGFAGSATAFAGMTNSGGMINVNTSGGGNMEMTVFDPMSALYLQNSGAVNLCNNAYLSFGNGGNNSGTATFNHNGGTVTFYSDVAITVGGAGYLRLGTGGDTGTYTYNLNGGTLTVPSIQRTASGGSGTFNFNGGTLKPTASTATFMSFLTAANVMSGGATIDTAGFDITIIQTLQNGGGGLTKLGAGKLTLGAYNYTGATVVKAGTLALDASQTSSGSDIAVTNATLAVSTGNGGSSLGAANLIFSGNTTNSFDFGTASSPAAAAIIASGVVQAGTTVINISGNNLVVGTYPLIFTGGSVPTTGFSLGSLPTGVVAHLSNSGTSLDLVITSTGQSLTWYGADSSGNPLATWDINTSSNWNIGTKKYLQYAGNTYGDNVTFDDNVFSGSTGVNLSTRVVPASVTFNSTQPYSLSGAGGIDGATSLLIGNSGAVTINTSTNFTGGTVINSGSTLIITNDLALGNNSVGVTMADGTLQLNGPVVSTRSITPSATPSIGVATNVLAQWNGNITGTVGLKKIDDGTLALGGSNNLSGTLSVNAGSVKISGGTSTFAGNPSYVGYLTGSGDLTMSGGTLTMGGELRVGGSDQNGAGINAVGTVNLMNASLNVGAITIARGNYLDNSVSGTVTLNNGSTLNSESDVLLDFAGGVTGNLVVNGGTLNVATTIKRWLIMSMWDAGAAELDVNSGQVNINANTDIRFATQGNTGTNVFNLNGGAVTFFSDNHTTVGGSGVVDMHQGFGATVDNTFNLNGGTLSVSGILTASTSGNQTFNFNGGTLKAVANNSSFVNLGTGSAAANVRNGGAVVDTAGFNVTIPQVLQHSAVSGDNAIDGGLIKMGLGTLALSGANTYNGNTTVQAGTLELVLASLATNSSVSISNGAQVKLDFGGLNQIGALILNGVSQPFGVYSASSSPTYISGTGSLLVGSLASNPTNVTYSVSGSTLTLSWPSDHLGWTLYTNSIGVNAANQWYPLPGSSGVTSTNLTINRNQGNVFFRLQQN